MATHHPAQIKLHQLSKTLEIIYQDGARFDLPFEYLRVYSPAAKVRTHTGTLANLVTGKQDINITPVGQYAIKIFFDD